MGIRCHPAICPKYPFPITGRFLLKNGQACIFPDPLTPAQLILQEQTCTTPNPEGSAPLWLKVEDHVTQAFDAFEKENKKAGPPLLPTPDYGLIILLGGKDGEMLNARVLAFIPLTSPTDNTKRMSPQRALDLYQTMFINRNDGSDKFYQKLVEVSLQQPIETATEQKTLG